MRPWIAQLTRRTCIDRLRSARETATEEVEPAGFDDRLAELDEALAVREMMTTLPENSSDNWTRWWQRLCAAIVRAVRRKRI